MKHKHEWELVGYGATPNYSFLEYECLCGQRKKTKSTTDPFIKAVEELEKALDAVEEV